MYTCKYTIVPAAHSCAPGLCLYQTVFASHSWTFLGTYVCGTPTHTRSTHGEACVSVIVDDTHRHRHTHRHTRSITYVYVRVQVDVRTKERQTDKEKKKNANCTAAAHTCTFLPWYVQVYVPVYVRYAVLRGVKSTKYFDPPERRRPPWGLHQLTRHPAAAAKHPASSCVTLASELVRVLLPYH
jgi:hypothetical protein